MRTRLQFVKIATEIFEVIILLPKYTSFSYSAEVRYDYAPSLPVVISYLTFLTLHTFPTHLRPWNSSVMLKNFEVLIIFWRIP